jgi:hypothetical protein
MWASPSVGSIWDDCVRGAVWQQNMKDASDVGGCRGASMSGIALELAKRSRGRSAVPMSTTQLSLESASSDRFGPVADSEVYLLELSRRMEADDSLSEESK